MRGLHGKRVACCWSIKWQCVPAGRAEPMDMITDSLSSSGLAIECTPAVQVGVLAPEPTPTGQLHTGQVGQPYSVCSALILKASSSCLHGASVCLLCSMDCIPYIGAAFHNDLSPPYWISIMTSGGVRHPGHQDHQGRARRRHVAPGQAPGRAAAGVPPGQVDGLRWCVPV